MKQKRHRIEKIAGELDAVKRLASERNELPPKAWQYVETLLDLIANTANSLAISHRDAIKAGMQIQHGMTSKNE